VPQNSNRPAKKTIPARRSTSFEPATAKAFGEVVRSLREEQGVAQDQFALLANVDRSYYGKLERGERQPSLGLLLRIAKGLGVPGASLVEKTELRMHRHRKGSSAAEALKSRPGNKGGSVSD
jgi:transcriptional regulator with XRE-family HTH domain